MWKFLALVFVIQGTTSQNCQNDWNNLHTCMTNRYTDYSAQRRLKESERTDLENKIRDCYLQQQCQDPFPPSNVTSAMRYCYYETQKTVRQDLESCVKAVHSDYELPTDDTLVYYWRQDEIYVRAAEESATICGPYTNENNLNNCVTTALSDAFANPSKTRDMCDVRQECLKQTSPACVSKWQDKVKPRLCQCSSNAPKFNGYKVQYKNCLQKYGYGLSDLDAYPKFLDNLKSTSCAKNDVCSTPGKGVTTQNPLGGLFGGGTGTGGSGGTAVSGGGGSSSNGIVDALGNLAKLITGSGGNLAGSKSIVQSGGSNGLTNIISGGGRGGGSSGGNANVLTNIVNALTGGTNALTNLFNGQGSSGLTNVLTPASGNNKPLSSLSKALSDSPSFGKLKGNGGYGSLLNGQGLNYDVLS